MSGTPKESEEVYRRMMVKLSRETGTMIRKEEVKRQALAAEANLHYAESLRKLLEEDCELLPRPLENAFKEAFGRFRKGEDVETIIGDWFRSYFSKVLEVSVIRPISEMLGHIESVNNFFDSVVNKMVEQIRKEAIYLHPIEPVKLPAQINFASIGGCLRDALNKMNMAIGILKGLIDASGS